MTFTSRHAAVLVLAAAGLMPAGAQAQWYSSVSSQPPLYPYAVQPNRPYAVEVAPNTYVIQRPGASRRQQRSSIRNTPVAPRSKADPALVEELRNPRKGNRQVIETTRVVRDKPVVIETKRYVDLPPRVIERYVTEENPVQDKPARAPAKRGATAKIDEAPADKRKSKDQKNKDDVKRVINAEAEITILGPDRMSIRLFRKGTKANASAE
ncbi:MAG: hypothetical protein Q8M24_14850 [Pseudolabrys sp.]|nr:hypothetical protein [Pseudolabrys sp.]MDP2296724.1 hypothetical protein [Pseudolabrys sp.]